MLSASLLTGRLNSSQTYAPGRGAKEDLSVAFCCFSLQLPNAYFLILGKQLVDTIGHPDYMSVVNAMPDILRVMPSVHGPILLPVTH